MSADPEDSRPAILTHDLDVLPDWYEEPISREFLVIPIIRFKENPDKYRQDIRGILLFPSSKDFITRGLLDQLPNVKVVGNHSVGVDHLNFDLLRTYGLRLASFGQWRPECVADLGIALLLAAARRLSEGIDMCRRGIAKDEMAGLLFKFPLGTQVTGSTIGIIGMGNIGFRLAEIASLGFNMRVLYHNRTPRSLDDEKKVSATYCERLDELLPNVDFLVLVCPLTSETNGLIGRRQFAKMKKTAILVNIARGDIVDHDALVEALKEGLIGGAALDVTVPEPLPPDHDLLNLSNVIVTPHIGSATVANRRAMLEELLSNVAAGIAGKSMPREVDLDVK